MHIMYQIQSDLSSCQGIENYTDSGFQEDVAKLKRDAEQCSNSNETKLSIYKLYTPYDIYMCSKLNTQGIDCEDISHAIKCLADKYNIYCEYYSITAVNAAWHQGIKCNVSDSPELTIIN